MSCNRQVQSWKTGEGYEDVAGFCKSASLEEIEKNGFVLTPGRYVGSVIDELSNKDFLVRFNSLKKKLDEVNEQSLVLDREIKRTLQALSND